MVLSSRPSAAQTARSKPSRFRELDGLRGLAALAVVLTHYTKAFDQNMPGHRPFPFPFDWGRLGVHLFFMISGFVIFATTSRYPRPGRFVLARAIRLYPTYWTCVSLTVIITWKINELSQRWPVNLANYTMLQDFLRIRNIDGAYWSLACELVFYAVIAILLAVSPRGLTNRSILMVVTVWPLLGLMVTFAVSHLSLPGIRLLVKGAAAEYAGLFCLGIVLYLVRAGERRWLAAVPPLTLCAVLAAQFAEGPTTSLPLILVIALFGTVVMRPRTPVLCWSPLLWLGGISYPLYLLHQNIGYTVLKFTADPFGPWLSRLLAFAAVTVLAWIVHEGVEIRLTRRINTAVRARMSAHPTTSSE